MEYIEGAYTYTAKPTETMCNAETKISASKTEISVNENILALLQSTDMFGRVLQRAATTGNADTAPENADTDGADEDAQTMAVPVAFICPITYRGYNYDFCTGLYYLQSRYYNPKWGRFLNCDDTNILLSTRGEDHGANLFAYGNNNPVNRVDYTGYECEELIGNILVYVLLPLVIISQKFESLGLSHILDKATPKFQLIYDASGILTYRFQLIFYTYSSQYVYYQELLDFDFYYANYNTWDYYLRNYNRKVPMTGLLKSELKKGQKHFSSLWGLRLLLHL